MYDLGLVSISFRKYSPEEILAAMKKADLKVIEWGSDVHAPYDNPENLENLLILMDKYGVKCCSYGTYFRLGIDNTEELRGYIKVAKKLGTDIVRIWCGEKGSAEFSDEEKSAFFEEGRKAAKIAEELGAVLCMECHNWTYTDTLETALELMNAVNSPNFKMYWQPNQFKTDEENFEYAQKIARYVEIVHTFNWKGEERFPLIDGVELWKKYLEKLGIEKPLLLEFMPDDKIETLPCEADTLRKIVE